MSHEENVSEKYDLPSPISLKERFTVGLFGLIAGTPTYLKSNFVTGESLYIQDQSSLISSGEKEKVWIRKGYDNFISKFDNDDVVIRLFINSASKFSTLPMVGNRAIIKEHETVDVNGRSVKKLELNSYFWSSYEDTLTEIDKIAKYIMQLGISEGEKIAIFADTHSEWLIMFMAILRVKCIVVTVYSTLNDEAIKYALNITDVVAIFVDNKSLLRLVNLLETLNSLRHVICASSCSVSLIETYKKHFSFPKAVKMHTFNRKSSVKPGRLKLGSLIKKKKSIERGASTGDTTKSQTEPKPKEEIDKSKSTGVKRPNSKAQFTQSSTFEKEVTFDSDNAMSEEDVVCEKIRPSIHPLVAILEQNVSAELPCLSQYAGEDEVLIMFTSGSTGMPKGVILTNKNLVAAVSAGSHDPTMWEIIVYPGFLPLAHVFELVCELAVCFKGGCIGYCRPLTLFDGSPMLADGQIGDFVALGPTISPFVPLILERLKKTIIEKVKEKGTVASCLLGYALNNKQYYIDRGVDSTLVEKIVFKKVRNTIGARLRFLICGGAPLSPDTEQFSNLVLGGKVKQGYGLTETSACGCIGNVADASFGNTGPPMPGMKLKLEEWSEGGYSPDDLPNPRGEVHLHGDCVSKGYYKMPDLTDEVFYVDPVTNEKWFKTGDIAELLPNGTFKIIDRKKDIIKLRNGEYISLVSVERAASNSPYVENLCAFPNKGSEFITLIVSTAKVTVEKLAAELNIVDTEYSAVIKNAKCCTAIFNNIMEACKTAKLSKNELPGQIHLVPESWIPDTGLVTPTMKVRRHEIANYYSHLF